MSEQDRSPKQVIVIRRDLKMRRGKEIAQGAHASTAWLSRRLHLGLFGTPCLAGASFTVAELAWLTGSFRKVTCQVPGEAEILELKTAASSLGVEAHVITDAGLTEFGGVPTVTAIGIGPDWADLVDQVTGKLALY
jgi:peptidyl-tRNA hydrolase, PTH2 family